MTTRLFALRFQPEAPQWSQGMAFFRDVFTLDDVYWRPAICKQWAKYAKIINPDLRIWATTDRWIEYKDRVVPSVDGPKTVIDPDAPNDYWLKKEDGSPAVLHDGHKLLFPNHDSRKPVDVAKYIINRYLVDVLGEDAQYIHGYSHDWCQDGYWGDEGLDADGIVDFRRLLLSELRALGKPVTYNPGGASVNVYDDEVDGVMMEGHELGGTNEQIRSAMMHWRSIGKPLRFISRPCNEEHGEFAGNPNPGRTNNERLIRADYCRSLIFGADYSASAGFGYDGQFADMIHELAFDPGDATGDPESIAEGVWSRTFQNFTVYYSESDLEHSIVGYALNSQFDKVTLKPLVTSSIHPSREIGDGAIVTKKPTLAIADVVAGLDWMRSSPPQRPVKLDGGHWANKTSVSTGNPVTDDPYFAVGPIYNTDVTYGAPYSAHGDKRVDESTGHGTSAHLVAPVTGSYDICELRDGAWTVSDESVALEKGHVFNVTAKNVTAFSLRLVDREHVKHATKWEIHGSDSINTLYNGQVINLPIINVKDQCFGIELDGYQRPFSIVAEVGGKDFSVPIELMGGLWGPFHRSFRFAAVFPEFEVSGTGVIKYIRLKAQDPLTESSYLIRSSWGLLHKHVHVKGF